MKLTIVNIGKTQETYLKEGISEYENRLKYFVKIEQLFIKEAKYIKKIQLEQIKKEEGIKILDASSKFEYVVVLDEKGRQLSSKELAVFFQRKINENVRHIGIIIGGAHGISQDVINKADFVWSLSNLTFSHQMIRLFMIEQVYRAFAILNNIPYHND